MRPSADLTARRASDFVRDHRSHTVVMPGPDGGGSPVERITSVLLVDSPRAVRDALGTRLSLEPGLAIVGATDDATLAIRLARTLQPDVVLVDAEACDLDASSLVRALTEWDSPSAVVVLTQHAVVVEHGLHGMATAVVGKNEGLGSLVRAIRSARHARGG
jgi:DNA-binding NarL/FixJ family response regulator